MGQRRQVRIRQTRLTLIKTKHSCRVQPASDILAVKDKSARLLIRGPYKIEQGCFRRNEIIRTKRLIDFRYIDEIFKRRN
jgi:hypothetical protein